MQVVQLHRGLSGIGALMARAAFRGRGDRCQKITTLLGKPTTKFVYVFN